MKISKSMMAILAAAVVVVGVLIYYLTGKGASATTAPGSGGGPIMPTVVTDGSVTRGQQLNWSVTGFTPFSGLRLLVNNHNTNTVMDLAPDYAVKTDASGAASGSFGAGTNIVGADTLTINDQSGKQASASFTVN